MLTPPCQVFIVVPSLRASRHHARLSPASAFEGPEPRLSARVSAAGLAGLAGGGRRNSNRWSLAERPAFRPGEPKKASSGSSTPRMRLGPQGDRRAKPCSPLRERGAYHPRSVVLWDSLPGKFLSLTSFHDGTHGLSPGTRWLKSISLRYDIGVLYCNFNTLYKFLSNSTHKSTRSSFCRCRWISVEDHGRLLLSAHCLVANRGLLRHEILGLRSSLRQDLTR